MRPFLALAVVISLLGGLQFYMWVRPRPVSPVPIVEPTARGQFDLEITLTFVAGPDAFAVDLSDAPSLLVTFRGKDVLRLQEEVAAGEQVRVSGIEGVVTGDNEFFVRAVPADSSDSVARAIRVRILRDGAPIAEQSIWSEPGESVDGVVVVPVRAEISDDADQGISDDSRQASD